MSNNIIYEANNITIINDNIIQAPIQTESIDLVITSPPYNVNLDYNEYKDNLSYSEYLKFSEKWLQKIHSVLKPDGRLCLNIPLDININFLEDKKTIVEPIYSDLLQIAKLAGLKYHGSIIWIKHNVSRRTAWGSYQSASAPCVIAPIEFVILFYKETWKKKSEKNNDITSDEFIDWTDGIWEMNYKDIAKIGHPAAFPEELPHRCIKLFSYVGDTVLDPFMGSGTTLVSAFKNKRKAIGVDISREYCDYSVNRLKLAGINAEANLRRVFK